jgi:hypothetical protein
MKEFYFEDKLVPHSNYFISYRGFPLTAEALQRVVIINCFGLERIGINN